MIGGCRLCRSTSKLLEEVGLWEKIDLAQPQDESPYEIVPHVLGVLTNKKYYE